MRASGSQNAVERGCRLLLHPLGDVAVHVHHERGRGVTESLGYDARVNTLLQQHRRGGPRSRRVPVAVPALVGAAQQKSVLV